MFYLFNSANLEVKPLNYKSSKNLNSMRFGFWLLHPKKKTNITDYFGNGRDIIFGRYEMLTASEELELKGIDKFAISII